MELEPGKLFVGGISWETNDESMKRYFEQFGSVAYCKVMKNPGETEEKKNRGFGFVTFDDPDTVSKVLSLEQHILDGKKIDPKAAVVKMPGKGEHNKKAFLGGIASDTTEDDIRTYFESAFRQGCVVSVDLKFDRVNNRLKGFGFVEFTDEELRDQVVRVRYHEIKQKRVEAKKAEPRGPSNQPFHFQGSYAPAQHQSYPFPQAGASSNAQYNPYYGTSSQYYPYPTQQQTGYGHQTYSTGAGYHYDHSGYGRTQTSTGERPDQQTFYQTQPGYGHNGAQQMTTGYSHAHDTGAYGSRTGYPTSQSTSYNQQLAGYGGQPATHQPHPSQSHYGAPGTTTNFSL